LIEERLKNKANKDHFIFHEEMMKILNEKRAKTHDKHVKKEPNSRRSSIL